MSERIALVVLLSGLLLLLGAESGVADEPAQADAPGAKIGGAEAGSAGDQATARPADPEKPVILTAKQRLAKAQTVPKPVLLADSEDVVQEQYAERRAQLDALLADPEPKIGPLSWSFGRMGMWAHAYRFHDSARIAYENAMLFRPSDHRWPYLLGHLHQRLGERSKALASFARAHRVRPDDVPALVWLAEVELAAGDLESAQEHVLTALDLDPRCTQASLVDGRIAYAREEYGAAVSKLRRAQRFDMRSKKIRYALGLAYRAAGDLERAELAMKRATKSHDDPDSPLMQDPVLRRMRSYNIGAQIWVLRGSRAAKRGDRARAVSYFEKALSLDPDRVSVQARYARALVEAGRYAEAIEILEPLQQAAPEEAVFQHHLALAQLLGGEHEKAELLLRGLLKRDPKHVNARYALAQVLHKTGRNELALVEFERAIADDPGRERFRLARAFRLIDLGRHAEAVAALEEDVQIVPKAASLSMLLVRLLASSPNDASRDGARSLELSKQLRGNRRPNLGFAETLAMAHAENGDFVAAIAWQQAAVEGAERAKEEKALRRARERLASYEQKKPCRAPWFEGEEATHTVRVRAPRTPPSGETPDDADA